MATSPYNYSSTYLPDGSTDEENQRRNADSPAPYQPNDRAPTSQTVRNQSATTPTYQPTDRSPQAYQPPVTFAQQQAAGVARPPAPNENQYVAPGMANPQTGPTPNAPGVQNFLDSTASDRATRDALQQKMTANPGYQMTPDEEAQWNAAQDRLNASWGPFYAQAQQHAAATPQATPAPARYLQGGQEIDAQGRPVAGGYNALSDYYTQTGITPGVSNNVTQDLLNQNPNLNATGQTPSSGAPATGQTYNPAGGYNPSSGGASAAAAGSVPGGTYNPNNYGSPGTSQGQGFDILNTLINGASGRGAGSDVQNATQAAALKLLQNPSPYGQQDVKDLYNWESGNIDDQYALQRKAIDNAMAARGLGTSSIHAGNLEDLNIGQRSAKESLAQDLAHQYASTLGGYQQGAIGTGNQVGTQAQNNALGWLQNLMGFGQQGFQNDLATNAVNQNASNSWQNFIMQLLGAGYG